VEHDPVWYASEARDQLVEQRRLLIRAIAAGHSRAQMEAHLDMIVKLQSAIDVIDRVSDEGGAAVRSDAGGGDARSAARPRVHSEWLPR
jgi:hypothetical protein